MNQTVELVKRWGDYEASHPQATIADFCRHYLIMERETESSTLSLGGIVPMHTGGVLMKTMARISKLNESFAALALKGTGISQIDEYGMLHTIRLKENPKKSEVIYAGIQELSSGTVMLNRLLKNRLIREFADDNDKRSKRVTLTGEGRKVLETCTKKIRRLTDRMLDEMDGEDKKLCIRLLSQVEIRFSALWMKKQKGKSFDDLFKDVIDEKQ